MKRIRRRNKKTSSFSLVMHMHHRLREGVLIFILAISAYLLVSLLTYHASDPSWSNTGSPMQVLNAGGRVGAWLADILLYLCGYIAYLFPIMFSSSAFHYFKHQSAEPEQALTFLKSMGFLLVVLSGTGVASLYLASSESFLPFTSGGIIGNVVGFSMEKVFSSVGASLILIPLLLGGFTIFTGISWLKVIDSTGKFILFSTEVLKNKMMLKKQTQKTEPKYVHPQLTKQELKEDSLTSPKIFRVEPKLKANEEEDKSNNSPRVKHIESEKIKPEKKKLKENKILFEPALEGTLPPITLLDLPDRTIQKGYSNQQLEIMSREVELRLQDFGIDVKVVAVHPGPVVTRFELQLAAGTKVSKISALAKDLARSLSVVSVRIVEIIPGKPVIGLELPNEQREVVRLRDILASQQYANAHSPLALALGKDIAGHPVIVDLAKMPHMLVAGTTGSGKSVGLNAMLLSLLFKAKPSDLRLILIDPKMLELAVYEGIPHLLTPVVTDMKDAASALRWCVAEMERRYKLMASLGVRNIIGYNQKIKEAIKKGAPLLDMDQELQELPYIVVLADEFADMMMVVGKKVEELIARIAQKARAAGIHLILATQRPSVDVITGLIKANIPTRISFQVSSKIDSRTILDQQGAEQLLGHGDMLYLPPGSGVPVRVHGAYVADEEVHRVVSDWKRRGRPDYLEEVLTAHEVGLLPGEVPNFEGTDSEQDPLYDQAVQIVIETRRASISNIQRRLKIGYNRAARIVEAMEIAGLVSPMEGNGSREVLVPGEN